MIVEAGGKLNKKSVDYTSQKGRCNIAVERVVPFYTWICLLLALKLKADFDSDMRQHRNQESPGFPL